jgi:hypothetical protein
MPKSQNEAITSGYSPNGHKPYQGDVVLSRRLIDLCWPDLSLALVLSQMSYKFPDEGNQSPKTYERGHEHLAHKCAIRSVETIHTIIRRGIAKGFIEDLGDLYSETQKHVKKYRITAPVLRALGVFVETDRSVQPNGSEAFSETDQKRSAKRFFLSSDPSSGPSPHPPPAPHPEEEEDGEHASLEIQEKNGTSPTSSSPTVNREHRRLPPSRSHPEEIVGLDEDPLDISDLGDPLFGWDIPISIQTDNDQVDEVGIVIGSGVAFGSQAACGDAHREMDR